MRTGTSLDQPVGMSSVDFHTTYQQDGPTVSVTMPGTELVLRTNLRFLELVLEPTKLPCALQKLHCIRAEIALETRLQVDDLDWHRWLVDEQFEIPQLLEHINDGDATHIQALLEPTLALLDPEDLRAVNELAKDTSSCYGKHVYCNEEESCWHNLQISGNFINL